jgi:hypothetical protein
MILVKIIYFQNLLNKISISKPNTVGINYLILTNVRAGVNQLNPVGSGQNLQAGEQL